MTMDKAILHGQEFFESHFIDFSEIAQTSLRGGLASLMQLQSNIGVAFVTGLNIHQAFHWVSISWACMAVPGNEMRNHTYQYISIMIRMKENSV